MRLKKTIVSIACLAAVLVFAAPSFSEFDFECGFFFEGNYPPVGEECEYYYTGIWQWDLQERCYREYDGGYVPFGGRLYVAVDLCYDVEGRRQRS